LRTFLPAVFRAALPDSLNCQLYLYLYKWFSAITPDDKIGGLLIYYLSIVGKSILAQTLTIINSIKNNFHNPMAKKDKSMIESTIRNYNDYKIHKYLVLYLQKTGDSYQGKNLNKKKNVEKLF
jgi:hypothetical protein